MAKEYKPIIVLDFDGVIHSYSSGWKGASVIPDKPVPDAIEFILNALKQFDVAILSSRSHKWGGKRAMKAWLKKNLIEWMLRETDNYHGYSDAVRAFALADFKPRIDRFEDEVEWWANGIIRQIKWPWFKPAAFVTIDDRAVTFTGKFPEIDEIKKFKPWSKT